MKNCLKIGVFQQLSYFSDNFSLFSGGGRNSCFSYFFPISGRRPEIPVLAGGQGRNSFLKSSEKRLIHWSFWDTLWEQFCLLDQRALIDASLWRKPLRNLRKSSSAQPKTQLSKPLWERNGLNISRLKLFRRISWKWRVCKKVSVYFFCHNVLSGVVACVSIHDW